MSDELVKYNITKMNSDYLSAKRTIWDTWIEVRKQKLSQEYGIAFEQAILRFAEDIQTRRKMSTDEMVERCIREISESQ